jgi:hypothetical protein
LSVFFHRDENKPKVWQRKYVASLDLLPGTTLKLADCDLKLRACVAKTPYALPANSTDMQRR